MLSLPLRAWRDGSKIAGGRRRNEHVLSITNLRLRRGDARDPARRERVASQRGELVALMGLSGGGKTTVLRCVAALETFDDGAIDVGGVVLRPGPLPPRATMRELRTRVGMVFQLHYLFEHLSAIENVTLAPMHVAHVAARRRRTARAASCSNRSASRIAATRCRASSPAARRSASPSPAPWPWSRRCC